MKLLRFLNSLNCNFADFEMLALGNRIAHDEISTMRILT